MSSVAAYARQAAQAHADARQARYDKRLEHAVKLYHEAARLYHKGEMPLHAEICEMSIGVLGAVIETAAREAA